MPLFFLGTREWRNRQTRTVQVRVPVMEWGFNSPLAHDETADPSGSAVFVFPGCGLWPRWCSGRRRARPPARLGGLTLLGAAPRSPPVPSGPSGALHTGGAWCAGVWLGASSQGPPWPCRHPPAPRPGPAAHGRRSLALLRPPHRWGPVADWCVVSKPGQTPPSPTGTAARPRASKRSLSSVSHAIP